MKKNEKLTLTYITIINKFFAAMKGSMFDEQERNRISTFVMSA